MLPPFLGVLHQYEHPTIVIRAITVNRKQGHRHKTKLDYSQFSHNRPWPTRIVDRSFFQEVNGRLIGVHSYYRLPEKVEEYHVPYTLGERIFLRKSEIS